jgi:chaperonin GroES
MTPSSANVLVKIKEKKQETAGGLVLPENAQKRPTEGVVIATGPGIVHPESGKLLDLDMKVGDAVMYGDFDGAEVEIDGEPHQILRDKDLIAGYPANEEISEENIRVFGDCVLVRLAAKETKSRGGIILTVSEGTEDAPQKVDYGIVVAVGPGHEAMDKSRAKPVVKSGDSIRFLNFQGAQIKMGKNEYAVIRDASITCRWTAIQTR